MTALHIEFALEALREDLERYEQDAWSAYEQAILGSITLHEACNRVTDLQYKAHQLFCHLRHVPPVSKHARRQLWSVGLLGRRLRAQRQAEFLANKEKSE